MKRRHPGTSKIVELLPTEVLRKLDKRLQLHRSTRGLIRAEITLRNGRRP